MTGAMALALAASGTSAVGYDVKEMDQAALEKSWAMQAELARIEANKEEFVDGLLASWAPYVDANAYDLVKELKPIAMRAYPWRLLGASKAGDFDAMVSVMRGKSPAAPYVNLDKPEEKLRQDPTKVLGDATNSLVFTPIAPCRIADTRGTGARTGILNPGTPRVFDLTTDAFAEGQGGDLACAGLPSFSHYGWSANITVTGMSTIGGLQTWGFTGPIPSTSIINFEPGFAVANSSTLTGCNGCADDIVISAFGGPVHVIIDVMGYFERATGFSTGTGAVTMTNVAGTPFNLGASSSAFINGGACPAGTVLVSGGMTNGNKVWTSDQIRQASNIWRGYYHNPDAATSVTVSSHCIDVN